MDEQTDFERTVHEEFRKYDVTDDGYVTITELRDVLRRCCDTMTCGEIDEFLDQAEVGECDRVNYRECFTGKF